MRGIKCPCPISYGVNRLFLSIFLIGSSIIFTVFAALPRFQEFSAIQKELRAKQDELASRESYFNHLRDLQERLNAEPLVAKIDAAIPNDPQLPAFHDFLQNMSAGSGLSLRSIVTSQGGAIPNSRLKGLGASLQLGGSYEGLKLLLASLLRASRMTNVESISFASPQEGTGFVFYVRTNSYSY